MEVFIRGQWFHVKNSEELLALFEPPMDKGRNLELGKLAYEVYRCRLREHQNVPEELTWDRLPPYMHDIWVMVAEIVELYVKDRGPHHK